MPRERGNATAELMSAALKTPICDLLGCEVPVVLAGMGGVARSELVAAVTMRIAEMNVGIQSHSSCVRLI